MRHKSIMSRWPTLLSMVVACGAVLVQAEAAGPADNASPSHVPVFVKGTYGSRYYRIPALATASDGTVIAVADKRIERSNDLPGKIDIVCRRSADGGRTWGGQITVAANDSAGGYGDAALVSDRLTGDLLVMCAHGNGLWQDSPAHIMTVRSSDNGLTWSDPVDISGQLMPAVGDDVAGWFASSGAALQLADGRLMFALVVRRRYVDDFEVYAVYSDDSGHTWHVSATPAHTDGDESKIAQLPDGRLLMSIRNRRKGLRRFAASYDRGVTWHPVQSSPYLSDPACNGDLLACTASDGRGLLLQSLPAHPTDRTHVSVYVSEDGGVTWPRRHLVVPANSSYSSMTQLPGGGVGILIEEEAEDGDGHVITFTALPDDM